jgi:hypothetical protein
MNVPERLDDVPEVRAQELVKQRSVWASRPSLGAKYGWFLWRRAYPGRTVPVQPGPRHLGAPPRDTGTRSAENRSSPLSVAVRGHGTTRRE